MAGFWGSGGSFKQWTGATLIVPLLLVLLFTGCAGPSDVTQRPRLPAVPRRGLVADGHIDFAPIGESSGLVQSRQYPGVFWTHNDSGDVPRLFAIRADGSLVRPADDRPYDGIHVLGAANKDWEDITLLPDGQLVISDLGNNANKRRDLALYFVPEPNPYEDRTAQVSASQRVYYPEQKDFPPVQNNFDNEAVFYWDRLLCFLTKHRADGNTTLYVVGRGGSDKPVPLRLQTTYDLEGQVTAADAYEGRIAVLTYNNVWVFQPKIMLSEGGSVPELYSGAIWWRPIHAGQCESVAFIDRDTLLIGNEQRDLYEVKLGTMSKVR